LTVDVSGGLPREVIPAVGPADALGDVDRVPGVVLFDCFGVIARLQDAEGLAALEVAAGVRSTEQAARFWEAYWRWRVDYDRGVLDAASYWPHVVTDAGTAYDPAMLATLHAADMASWAATDPAAVALVEELQRAGIGLGLLSNIPTELADRYAGMPWLRGFAVVGFSCRIGFAKPDGRAFDWALAQCAALGVAAPGILFVDDSPANIAAAATKGMATHHFTSVARLRADRRIQSLLAVG